MKYLVVLGLIFISLSSDVYAQRKQNNSRTITTKINDSVIEYQLFKTKSKKHLILKCFYKNGQLDSTCNAFYKIGNINYTERWKNNRIIERSAFYDIKGKSLPAGNLINGTGSIYGYYKNGEIAYEFSYINGLKNGNSKYFSKDGSILFTEKYENDSLILKTEYNGNLIAYETPFKNGKKNGIAKVYDKTGKVTYLLIFENDICVKKITN